MTLGPFLGFLCYVLGTKLGGGFAVSDVFRKGCSGCLFLALEAVWLQQHHSSTSSSSSSHQQQHQQHGSSTAGSRQAAAGSRRQLQAAAGSSRQQQAAADTSRGSSRQQQAAAGSGKVAIFFYSRVSEVTLGPFLGFLCYVLDTKLGGGLLFRMCFEKGVWLFVSCFGGCLIAAAPQQRHSSSSSHQQLHQQQAAATFWARN